MGIFQAAPAPAQGQTQTQNVGVTCWVSPLGSTMVSVPPRPNGTLPGSVEIQNNTIYFKGPVSYSVAGTYVCEATNAIGTRSGLVEVNVTGRTAPGTWKRRWAGRQRCEQLTSPPVPSPQSPVSPFGGGSLVVPMGQRSSWLWNGVALVCFGFSFFLLSSRGLFLSYTKSICFPPTLSSALDSEMVVRVNSKDTSGRY